jgi:hypothetical protein
MPSETILSSAMAMLTALFVWLQRRTNAAVTNLKNGEQRCRTELSGCRLDLEKLRLERIEDQETWKRERDRFYDEISRQERDRHQLTYENNRLLAEKCQWLERKPA